METYLRSSQLALDIFQGQPDWGSFTTNLLFNSIYYLPGFVMVGINPWQSLTGSLLASTFIQIFVLSYIGWNFNPIQRKVETQQLPIPILPSSKEAEDIMAGKVPLYYSIWGAIQRMPIIIPAFWIVGANWKQIILGSFISSLINEYSVLELVKERMEGKGMKTI